MNLRYIDPLSMWLLAYALPMVAAGIAVKSFPEKKDGLSTRNGLIMHAALIISIVVIHYFLHALNLTFPWHPGTLSIITYIVSIVIVAFVAGSTGIWYALSALVQELTLTSITFLLLPALPLYLVLLLVVPVYVFDHTLRAKQWRLRIALLTLWGAISVVLFSAFMDVYVLAALHILFGTILIKRSIILHPAKIA